VIDDQIHHAGPDGLTDAEHEHLRRQVLTSIHTIHDSPRKPNRARRGVVAALAVAAILGTATAAAATYVALTRPDPKQAATILDHAQALAAAHGPDWRPELNAELVYCRAPNDADSFEAYASAGPLGGTVEAAELIEACAAKSATLGQAHGPTPTLCSRPTGDLGRPVVLLDGTACAGVDLQVFGDSDLQSLNAARSTEVAVLAIDEACPSRDRVIRWAESQLEASGSDLALIDSRAAGSPPQVCFGTYIDWTARTATVDIISYSN
jgi:hypothetical protein